MSESASGRLARATVSMIATARRAAAEVSDGWAVWVIGAILGWISRSGIDGPDYMKNTENEKNNFDITINALTQSISSVYSNKNENRFSSKY
jgi:hypothetical protein